MVGRHQAARNDPYEASRALLALLRIDDPSVEQEVGALLVAEFVLKVNRFIPWSR